MLNLFNGKRKRLLKEIVRAELSHVGRGYAEVMAFIDGKSGKFFLFPYRKKDGALSYYWVSRRHLLSKAAPGISLYTLLLTAPKNCK